MRALMTSSVPRHPDRVQSEKLYLCYVLIWSSARWRFQVTTSWTTILVAVFILDYLLAQSSSHVQISHISDLHFLWSSGRLILWHLSCLMPHLLYGATRQCGGNEVKHPHTPVNCLWPHMTCVFTRSLFLLLLFFRPNGTGHFLPFGSIIATRCAGSCCLSILAHQCVVECFTISNGSLWVGLQNEAHAPLTYLQLHAVLNPNSAVRHRAVGFVDVNTVRIHVQAGRRESISSLHSMLRTCGWSSETSRDTNIKLICGPIKKH